MNQKVKNWLQGIGVYYPLQGFYRGIINRFIAFMIKRKYAVYRGEGYTCNYCGASYIKFAPWYPKPENAAVLTKYHVIAGYGENIICPACSSTARERLLKAVIIASIDIEKKQVLHISPEKNLFDYIKQQAIVTTVDYHPQFYKSIDPAVQFADATRLSFADDSFDIVIGNHIMEHIPDDMAAMKEIYRVLKPGGTAILQVPFSATLVNTVEEPAINNPARQSALFGQHDHVRIYALTDYMERLMKAGFSVNYQRYESLASFYKYAIQEEEGFLVVRK
jgi:SAM-dependent methyltransferase